MRETLLDIEISRVWLSLLVTFILISLPCFIRLTMGSFVSVWFPVSISNSLPDKSITSSSPSVSPAIAWIKAPNFIAVWLSSASSKGVIGI